MLDCIRKFFLKNLGAKMQHTINISITKDELQEMIHQELKNAVLSARKHIETEDEILTQDQTTKLLNISRVGLWEWRKKGWITYHKIGGRVYFRRSDINQALKRHNLSNPLGGQNQ